ncbi:hypothetical protein EDB87DRAFT_1243062 [Lactarius vividus]|nr:hypothetical protein EDB87DRAFT_1243062 [Lactarius vividus]
MLPSSSTPVIVVAAVIIAPAHSLSLESPPLFVSRSLLLLLCYCRCSRFLPLFPLFLPLSVLLSQPSGSRIDVVVIQGATACSLHVEECASLCLRH